MTHMAKRFRDVLKPKPGEKAWGDVLMLVVFGSWFFIPIFGWLFDKPQPNAYKCAGPGFVDYGCAGGRDAIIDNIIVALFMTFLFSVFLVALLRLINRYNGHNHG